MVSVADPGYGHPMTNPTPTQPAPALDVPVVDGDRFVLADQNPDRFTLAVFYRGLHCPVCRSYLKKMNSLADDFSDQGVDISIAVSMDTEDKAREAKNDWGIDRIPVGYGLTEDSARDWGLYMSKAINDGEPDRFSEPGLFLVRPDGSLYYSAINSMPFGRPKLEDMVKALEFVNENDYPARGEA